MSRSKQPKEQVQGADKFTAVILADTFTHDFKPITLDLPRALLPICNVPILDYTIEFLILNGVEEIFVLCAAHAEKVKQHVTTSRWANCKDVSIKVLIAKCENPGDAIRHLNDYDVLRQDFVLVSGDIITNFANLKSLLRRHKERREAEPSILLTLVFREEEYFGDGDSDLTDYALGPLQPTWSISHGRPLIEEYVTAIMEPDTGILHSCQPWVSRKFSCQEDADTEGDGEAMRYLTVDLKLLKDNPTLQCRSDLIDTNIVICSLELLSLFKQEFDFFDIKHDCVQSILEHDILGNKMAADIIRAPYYGRVASFNHYAALSQAILGRWMYPMVPDNNFSSSSHHSYTPHDNNVYLGTGVKLCRGVTLGNDVLVGHRTMIESGVVLMNCTIGANCRIGRNTKITNASVLDNVHIGDNCAVESAILSPGVRVMNDVTVSPGTILAQNVQIAAGHTTIPNSRVHAGGDNDPLAVGSTGVGSLWTPIGPQMRFLDVHMRVEPEDDEDSLDDRFEELLVKDSQSVSTRVYAKAGRVQPAEEEEEVAPEQNFFMEIEQLIHRALRENHQKDNAMLEIHGLKFGYNRSFQECARGTIRGFVTYFDDGTRTAKQFKDDMTRVLKKNAGASPEGRQEDGWASIFAKFVRSESDCEVQLEMLDELTELAKSRKVVQAALVHLLMFFHSEDILDEEGILKWVANIDQNGTEEEKQIRSKCDKFIEWLKQEEEEEEEED